MSPRLLPFFITALVLAGCRDEKITAYRVPKEAPAPVAASLAGAATGAPAIHWQIPANWQAQALDSVRVGSFLVSGADGAKADISVTTFPGDAGGDLANVNRWRGQLGLPPIDDSALAGAVQIIDAPAGKFSLVEISGESAAGGAKKPARMLGAWLQQPGRRWFFKLLGDSTLATAQQDVFVGFLKSVSIDAAPAQAQSTNDLPKNNAAPLAPFAAGALPDASVTPDTAPPDAVAPAPPAALTWTAPAGWRAKPLGAMRIGSFTASSSEGDADISVISFPGEAGGLLANINRWRGQLGLDPLAENDVTSATTTLEGAGGLHFTIVDFAGQTGGAPARMLGAILSFGGQTYFFKVTGPVALVAREKPAFLDFLKTVKAP